METWQLGFVKILETYSAHCLPFNSGTTCFNDRSFRLLTLIPFTTFQFAATEIIPRLLQNSLVSNIHKTLLHFYIPILSKHFTYIRHRRSKTINNLRGLWESLWRDEFWVEWRFCGQMEIPLSENISFFFHQPLKCSKFWTFMAWNPNLNSCCTVTALPIKLFQTQYTLL